MLKSDVNGSEKPKRVLVLGASGMLGNAIFRFFANSVGYDVYGSVRSAQSAERLPLELRAKMIPNSDVENLDAVVRLFGKVEPHIVVNCIGIVKQLSDANDPLTAIPINALLPHRLARISAVVGARFIHVSTDCVFSGKKGMYSEDDFADCYDLYGRSKFLGEVDYPNAITLRTSIIGHELGSTHSLLNWFLSQTDRVNGYRKALFSGLPTVEIARVIRDFVLPHPELRGIYHLSAEPINKYELLRLFAHVYGKTIWIEPDDLLEIDRSLDSRRFRAATGYIPPPWRDLIETMREFR